MKLTKKQKAYIEASLANPTMSDAKIGELIDTSATQICKWNANPEFKAEVDARIKEQWADAVKLAKERIIDIAINGQETNSFNAAKFIMQTNGFSEKQQVDINTDTGININVNIEDN